MIRCSHVLYCTDFSEEADMACHHALDFAQRYGAKLHVLHILHSPFKYWLHLVDEFVDAAEVVEEVSEAIVEKARTYLEEHYAYVLTNLKGAVYEVKPGVPFMKIVRYARENAVDLVVMGASGSSELDKMTFDSTVENAACLAHCHVMAIRNPEMAFTLPG